MTTNSRVRPHGEECKTAVPSTAGGRTEQFNPYGLHSIRVPLGLVRYPNVSWGAKCLYARLALFRGAKPDGYCNPSLEQMAAAMGSSVDTIGRFLAELTREGFIRRKRNRRQRAQCIFLPHPCLSNSATLRNQGNGSNGSTLSYQGQGLDSATLRNQDHGLDSANLRPRLSKSEILDSADLPAPYKEENIHRENIHKTSSSAEYSSVQECATTEASDDENSFSSEKSKNQKSLDRNALVETVREQLRMARAAAAGAPVEQIALPDRDITAKILDRKSVV